MVKSHAAMITLPDMLRLPALTLVFASLLTGCAGTPTAATPPPHSLQLAQDVARQGDPASAALLYERAIGATGETADALLGLGQARLDSGNNAGAQEAFQRALALQAGNVAAMYGLGTSELREGAVSRAASHLAQSAPRIGTRQAFTRWGYAAIMAGDTRNAVDAFRRALRFANNDPDAQSNLALALALAGEKDEAGALAQRVALSPLARDSHRRDVALVLALTGQDDRIAQLLPDMHADQVQALVLSAHAIHELKTPAEQARALGELAASAH
jgi:Flp pilus assembly protein TadD